MCEFLAFFKKRVQTKSTRVQIKQVCQSQNSTQVWRKVQLEIWFWWRQLIIKEGKKISIKVQEKYLACKA